MSGDFISREALRDRVDEIIKTNHLRPDYVWFTPNGVKVLALEIPSADVVEVVRCRECVYWEPASPTKTSGNCNKAFEITAWATDFCSYGERKDGGQDT